MERLFFKKKMKMVYLYLYGKVQSQYSAVTVDFCDSNFYIINYVFPYLPTYFSRLCMYKVFHSSTPPMKLSKSKVENQRKKSVFIQHKLVEMNSRDHLVCSDFSTHSRTMLRWNFVLLLTFQPITIQSCNQHCQAVLSLIEKCVEGQIFHRTIL